MTVLHKLALMAAVLLTPIAQAQVLLTDEPVPGIAREVGYTPAADGKRLAYMVYRPAKLQRYPTLVWYDVYGAGSQPPMPFVQAWVQRGYAFVGVSARGTGCSEGEYFPFTTQDAKDGALFVDWVGAQAWSTGKVGTLGNSQPGILQFGIAAKKPKHLVAIAPGGTIRSIYSDAWYMGGIYNASFAEHWSRYDQPNASRAFADMRIKLGDEACKATAEKIGPNPLVRLIEAQRFDGEYYQQASPYNRAPEVTVPTLMVQSWTDPAVGSSALDMFGRVAAKHKRLFVLNGSHDAYHYATSHEEVARWMDRWVKGVNNGVEKQPRVRIDFQTTPTVPEKYGEVMPVKVGWSQSLPNWPAPNTQWNAYYLTAEGNLNKAAPKGKAAGSREYFYPSGTELPGDNTQFAVKPLDWGSLSYRSAPVKKDTAILGAPQLVFYASSAQADTDFMVNLHDVAPNGDVTFVQRGYLRASRRAVDESKTTSQYVFHPHLKDEALVAGQVYEFKLSLNPVVHVLRAGHSLQLLLAAPSTVPSPGWGLIPLMLPGFNTLYHDATRPSRLKIPVVPGVGAQAPMPECGTLPFQPCRRAAPETKS